MKKLTLIVSSIAVVIVSLSILLYVYRIPAAHWLAQSYLHQKDVPVSFIIEELGVSRIVIKDIQTPEGTHIPLVVIDLLDFKISSIKFKINRLDIDEAIRLKDKILPQSAEPSPPLTPQDVCTLLDGKHIDGTMSEVVLQKQVIPVALTASTHNVRLNIGFSGTTLPQHSPLTVKNFLHKGELFVDCREQKLQGLIELSGHIKGAQDQAIDIMMNSSKLEFKSTFKDISQTPVLFEGNSWRVNAPQKLVIGKVSAKITGLPHSPVVFLNIKNLTYKNDQKQDLAKDLDISSECQKQQEAFVCTSAIRDSRHVLVLDKIITELKGGTIKTRLPEHKNYFLFKAMMDQTFPILQKLVTDGGGKMEFSGPFTITQGAGRGQIQINGKNISLNTAFGKIEGLSLDHDVVSFPGLASSPHRELKIAQAELGGILKNFILRYQVINQKKVLAEKLQLDYDGAHVETAPFTIFVDSKRTEAFEAKITNYQLKKLLSMALKDKVSATGILSGSLKVQFKGAIPMMHGRLVADEPGQIQYRTGQPQKNKMTISDGPMDILYGYLYDFQYQSLAVDIQTDSKYNMIMVLSTYGHNPDYLNGKPLKLKINLEQNLVAALRSMVLTYDLPNRIKEHLEKADQE